MPIERRHTEFFGPDWSRAPVLSGLPGVAAIQVASALAQLRAPLLRGDTDVESHADFIRSLADRLFPDVASSLKLSVGIESADKITTQIKEDSAQHSLLQCWLADAVGGAETTTAPNAGVTWEPGATVLETITANKRYLVLTPTTGVINATVNHVGARTWYWAAVRQGRVVYSSAMNFA